MPRIGNTRDGVAAMMTFFKILKPRVSPLVRAMAGFALLAPLAGCSDPEAAKAVQFDYAGKAAGWPTCQSPKAGTGTQPGEVATAAGTRIVVKTPTNYRADIAHPLLVLYAAGGQDAEDAERSYEITRKATARGYVVASVDDKQPLPETVVDMAGVPKAVAKSWCIDESRIFATGHSNGGLYSNAVAFYPDARGAFRAIAPSAAGVQKQDLKDYNCPKPTPVKIYHGAYDMGFSGWGRGVAEWWAECNSCKGEKPLEGEEGCVVFQDCAQGGETIYCEGPWLHMMWPGRSTEILEFFDNYGSRSSGTPPPAG